MHLKGAYSTTQKQREALNTAIEILKEHKEVDFKNKIQREVLLMLKDYATKSDIQEKVDSLREKVNNDLQGKPDIKHFEATTNLIKLQLGCDFESKMTEKVDSLRETVNKDLQGKADIQYLEDKVNLIKLQLGQDLQGKADIQYLEDKVNLIKLQLGQDIGSTMMLMGERVTKMEADLAKKEGLDLLEAEIGVRTRAREYVNRFLQSTPLFIGLLTVLFTITIPCKARTTLTRLVWGIFFGVLALACTAAFDILESKKEVKKLKNSFATIVPWWKLVLPAFIELAVLCVLTAILSFVFGYFMDEEHCVGAPPPAPGQLPLWM